MDKKYEEMVYKLSPTLHKITHRLNGRFTFFNEDDLYQEALIHLWISHQNGKLADKTDSYILQGCYFYLKNHIRTIVDKAPMASLNELIDNCDISLEDTLYDNRQDSVKIIDERLVREYAEDKLNDRENEIISMAAEGMTVREIGKKLNISHVMVIKIRAGLKKKMVVLNRERGYQN